MIAKLRCRLITGGFDHWSARGGCRRQIDSAATDGAMLQRERSIATNDPPALSATWPVSPRDLREQTASFEGPKGDKGDPGPAGGIWTASCPAPSTGMVLLCTRNNVPIADSTPYFGGFPVPAAVHRSHRKACLSGAADATVKQTSLNRKRKRQGPTHEWIQGT